MNVGILSSVNNPLLPLSLMRCINLHAVKVFPIIDLKMFSVKDLNLWLKRTNEDLIAQAFSTDISLMNQKDMHTPFYFVKNHNSKEFLDLIRKLDINCMLNAGTPRKISQNILNHVEKGIVNVHPGVLPKYRGCSCIEWAIYNDDQIGNTVHLMTSDYDAGPVLKIETYNFSQQSNYKDIRTHVLLRSVELAAESLEMLANNTFSNIIHNSMNINFDKFALFKPMPVALEQFVIDKVDKGLYRHQKKDA